MHDDWPTQKQDMQLASEIIERHLEAHDSDALKFIEYVQDENKDEKISIRVPEWINELLDTLRNQYGYEHGHAVASKVLTRVFLKNETIH